MTEPGCIRSDGPVALIRPAAPSRCGARRREWLLTWRPPRSAGTEPRCTVSLRFSSLDAALAHARAEGWPVEVCDPPATRPRPPADTMPLEPPPPVYWWALEGRFAPPLAEAA